MGPRLNPVGTFQRRKGSDSGAYHRLVDRAVCDLQLRLAAVSV